ncbi:unnamed protein product [Arabis nemorensis]|uniref:Histone deacetylase complex subunit SAP18 n=1 Tax=Arabis nemorensis TaxID=586526 RepID=A0A565BQ43_9BRAS|nr:unnamed protein product [Arabis nemorensis]
MSFASSCFHQGTLHCSACFPPILGLKLFIDFADFVTGGHHTKEDYAVRGKEPKDEVQIYTWKDANLRELTDLVKEVSVAARRRNARLSFAFVYPDKNGRFIVREVGETMSYPNRKQPDDTKTLSDLDFEIGDYLDVAIY